MFSISDKIDAITGLPPAYRDTVIPPPRSVKIELTARCNFACRFCARSLRLREQFDMDRGFFSTTIADMRRVGVEELGLFYLGESFMCDWLPDAIKEAKDLGYPYVFLTTNGSLSTPERVSACMRAGLNSLKFSFNYADGAQLKEVARVKPSFFPLIKNNIRAAHTIREELGADCGLFASYIEYDGEQGERMREAIKEISPFVDEVYALPLYNQAGFVTEQEKKLGFKPSAGNRGRLDNLRDPLPCWAVFTEGHITWDGMLSACCFDHNDSFTMGNLNNTSFLDAWNSVAFQRLRAAHLNKDVMGTACEKCFVG